MPIRAILFDKDGTLVDFQRTWGPATHDGAIAALRWRPRGLRARRRRQPVTTPAARKLLPGSPVVIETTYGYGKLWARGARPAADAPNSSHEIDRMYFQTTLDHLTPMGDVKALLGGLAARGLRLGLMTNDADANTRAQLRAPRDRRACSNSSPPMTSGFGAKPAPDPVLAFAKFAGVAPAEIAVVGDTVHDLAAARAAGALAIGVLSGPTDARALLEPLADVLLPSVAELEAWIDQAV